MGSKLYQSSYARFIQVEAIQAKDAFNNDTFEDLWISDVCPDWLNFAFMSDEVNWGEDKVQFPMRIFNDETEEYDEVQPTDYFIKTHTGVEAVSEEEFKEQYEAL